MSDSDREVRPVWLTREQRDVLADWTHDDESGVPQVVAAWDAAPADSPTAIREAMLPVQNHTYDYDEEAFLVLHALGHPGYPHE